MGTTLTAVYVGDSELAIAHVGDSRAYLFRDRSLIRLTQDHSLVEELVRRGKLTEEQAAEHPQRSIITRALGVDPEVEVDTLSYSARSGDVVLLCSDGLTSMINEEQIAAILREDSDLDRAGERLIDKANEAGGRDNITVVLFRLEEAGGSPVAEAPTVVGLEPATDAPQGDDKGRGDARATASGREAGARAATGRRTAGATMTAAPAAARTRGPQTTAGGTPAPGATRPRLARTQGRSTPSPRRSRRGPRRFAKPLAALIAVVIVLFLVGGGGYLASRQLFFVGTNAQGVVTIFRGFPYDLPLGIHLYEQFYVSGVPVQFVPAARRKNLLNHQLRSQADAISLVHAAELGQLTK
jgi:protein phosphatase